jgi:hypothetical protein
VEILFVDTFTLKTGFLKITRLALLKFFIILPFTTERSIERKKECRSEGFFVGEKYENFHSCDVDGG